MFFWQDEMLETDGNHGLGPQPSVRQTLDVVLRWQRLENRNGEDERLVFPRKHLEHCNCIYNSSVNVYVQTTLKLWKNDNASCSKFFSIFFRCNPRVSCTSWSIPSGKCGLCPDLPPKSRTVLPHSHELCHSTFNSRDFASLLKENNEHTKNWKEWNKHQKCGGALCSKYTQADFWVSIRVSPEVRPDVESDSEHGSGDRLNWGVNRQLWNLMHALLHPAPHAHVVDHVTYEDNFSAQIFCQISQHFCATRCAETEKLPSKVKVQVRFVSVEAERAPCRHVTWQLSRDHVTWQGGQPSRGRGQPSRRGQPYGGGVVVGGGSCTTTTTTTRT